MQLMTINQAAEYLKIHHMTVRRLIKEDKLPAIRVGHSLRVPQDKLEMLLTPKFRSPDAIINSNS